MNKHSRRQRSRSRPAPTAQPRRIIQTAPFRRAFSQLPAEVQRSVQHKIAYLATDPYHPSLHVQRLHSRPGTWTCAVSRTYRLLYQYAGHRLILCDVKTHHTRSRSHRR